jgi:hypothetical protein
MSLPVIRKGKIDELCRSSITGMFAVLKPETMPELKDKT